MCSSSVGIAAYWKADGVFRSHVVVWYVTSDNTKMVKVWCTCMDLGHLALCEIISGVKDGQLVHMHF